MTITSTYRYPLAVGSPQQQGEVSIDSRCEHGVRLRQTDNSGERWQDYVQGKVNRKIIGSAVLSGEVCTACACGYESKTGQKTPATVRYISSSIPDASPPPSLSWSSINLIKQFNGFDTLMRAEDVSPEYVAQMRRLQAAQPTLVIENPQPLVIDGKTTHERWSDVDVFMTWRPKYQSKKWKRRNTTRRWLDRWIKHNKIDVATHVGNPWVDMSKFQPSRILQTKLTGTPILVPSTPTTIPSIVTECNKTGNPEWVYPYGIQPSVTTGVALDDALNSWKTTTSLDRGHGDTEYRDDGDAIEIAEQPQTSATLVPSVPSRWTVLIESLEKDYGLNSDLTRKEVTEVFVEYLMRDYDLRFDLSQKEIDRVRLRLYVMQKIQEFDELEPDGDGNRNARIAEFIKKTIQNDQSLGVDPDALSRLTEAQVRRIREDQRESDESPRWF